LIDRMATAGEGAKDGARKPRKAAATAAAKGEAPARRAPGRASGAAEGNDLRSELRLFASARPAGWDHRDWQSFLEDLQSRGHDTSSPDDIGRELERERLAVVLQQIQGLGPRRVDSLVARFETLWSASHAAVEEIAAVAGMNRPLAEKVRQALQR
jgi:hypothetical protein